jgi:hypothetical protein
MTVVAPSAGLRLGEAEAAAQCHVDQVEVLGMLRQVGPHVGALGDDLVALHPGIIEGSVHQRRRQSMATQVGPDAHVVVHPHPIHHAVVELAGWPTVDGQDVPAVVAGGLVVDDDLHRSSMPEANSDRARR